MSIDTVTVDTPVPFSINKLWFELHKKEHLTVVPNPGEEEQIPAYVKGDNGESVDIGDAIEVRPPLYRSIKTTGPAAERVQHGSDGVGIRQQLAALATKLRDPRLDFLFKPSPWRPNLEGVTAEDIDTLLEQWIGDPNPVTILDLSGIPSLILTDLIGALIRILYDAVFWARHLPEGARERPLLLVLEEAMHI